MTLATEPTLPGYKGRTRRMRTERVTLFWRPLSAPAFLPLVLFFLAGTIRFPVSPMLRRLVPFRPQWGGCSLTFGTGCFNVIFCHSSGSIEQSLPYFLQAIQPTPSGSTVSPHRANIRDVIEDPPIRTRRRTEGVLWVPGLMVLLLAVFMTFFEQYFLPVHLPRVGERSPQAVRAPYDFVFNEEAAIQKVVEQELEDFVKGKTDKEE